MTFVLFFIGFVCLLYIISKYEDADNHGKKSKRTRRNPADYPIKKCRGYMMSTEAESGTFSKPLTYQQKEARRLILMLLDIYRPKKPFQLKVSMDKPENYMGLYCEYGRKIVVYYGWRSSAAPDDIAVHEMSHLVYYDKTPKRKREKNIHGPGFRNVQTCLVSTAKKKGYRVSVS